MKKMVKNLSKSFSIIREETNLSSFKKDEEKIVVKLYMLVE